MNIKEGIEEVRQRLPDNVELVNVTIKKEDVVGQCGEVVRQTIVCLHLVPTKEPT